MGFVWGFEIIRSPTYVNNGVTGIVAASYFFCGAQSGQVCSSHRTYMTYKYIAELWKGSVVDFDGVAPEAALVGFGGLRYKYRYCAFVRGEEESFTTAWVSLRRPFGNRVDYTGYDFGAPW